MRQMQYSFAISHANKTMAGTLSSAPILNTLQDDELCNEVEACVNLVCRNLPASDECIKGRSVTPKGRSMTPKGRSSLPSITCLLPRW